MSTILLLKEEIFPSDPYRTLLEQAGHTVTFLPPLYFTYPARDELQKTLAQPETYSGLIVTSPRAVSVFLSHLEAHPHLLNAWKTKPAYVVGMRSAAPLRSKGFRTYTGKGTAHTLAHTILQLHQASQKPLLFLAGQLRREELPARLRAHGIPFEERTVYETHIQTDLPRPDPLPDWMVFFSPSGVEAAWRSFGPLPVSILAIGPTTARALYEKGIKPDAIAPTPSPEGILQALRT